MPATTPRPPSSEQVAAFDRNAWPRSIGMPGRNPRNPQDSDGDVGKKHGRRALPRCSLYALRDQHTLRVPKAPGKIDRFQSQCKLLAEPHFHFLFLQVDNKPAI